ncbi:MAG TPA: hypothetical protein VGQ94_05600 [Terriglobales bacterium]|nr:hypothetical protein [Terriglobales bacterium]
MKKFFAACVLAALFAGALLAQESLSLPSGTAVHMKLETPISTQTNKVGDTFAGRVTEPVMLNGKTVIPAGAAIQGQIVKLTQPRRVKGKPTIELRPDSITMPNGEKYEFHATVVDTDASTKTSVNDEGQIKGKGRDGKDMRNIAIGTGAGLGVGAVAAGGKGAVIGATIGAGVTVAHWLSKHKSAELPAGSEIVMELNRPMSMSSSSSGK